MNDKQECLNSVELYNDEYNPISEIIPDKLYLGDASVAGNCKLLNV